MNLNKLKKQRSERNLSYFAIFRKFLLLSFIKTYNFIRYFFPSKKITYSSNADLYDIQKRGEVGTDISIHLVELFTACIERKPKLIVELGTRGGESTFTLEKAARICGARLLCVDLEDCKDKCSPETVFVKSDDIEFGKNFKNWAMQNSFPQEIDFLFIDTSHEFEHTKKEIEIYFPLLSENAVVAFHDTNMQFVYKSSDGTLGYGYCDNIMRGVIGAIELFFDKKFNEKRNFIDYINGWTIRHFSKSNGFTILKK